MEKQVKNNYLSIFKSFCKLVSNKITRPLSDKFRYTGEIDIIVKKRGVEIDKFSIKNIVVNNGKQLALEAIALGDKHQIFRMAIGSDGAMTGDLFSPKIPTAEETALYHEVYRKDIGATPTIGTRQATFIAEFNSVDVPDSSFLNASKRYINEAALIMGDGVLGGGDKYSPQPPDSDESMFSKRCFKSIPFDAGDDITITVRWSIFAQ